MPNKEDQTPQQNQSDPNWNPQVAPQQSQPVQYVVTQNSLRGVGGWLLFFVIVFSLSALGYLTMFAAALDNEAATGGERVLALIMTPILAIAFLTSVVLISMQKKLAVLAVLVTLGLSALYTTISGLMTANDDSLGGMIIGIVIGLVFYGLLGLYFMQSRRAKETLIK